MNSQPHPAFGWGLIILFAAAAVAALYLFFIAPRHGPTPAQLARIRPLHMPALALEFMETPEQAANVLGAFERDELLRGVEGDDRVVIPLYTILLSAVAALIFLRLPAGVPAAVGIASVTLAVMLVCAAAWFDNRRENPSLKRLIGAGAPGAPAPLDVSAELQGLRRATRWKWGLMFAAFMVMGAMAAAHGGRLSILVAASYFVFAALGLAGLFSSQKALLEFAFRYRTGLPLLLTGWWLTRP